VPTLPINFEEIPSRAHWNFEEQNKVFESSVIIIPLLLMYLIIILYNYCIVKSLYFISNIGLLEEYDKN